MAEEHQTAQGYHAFVNGVFGLQAVENIYSQPVANQHHSIMIERLKTEQSTVAELLAAEIVRARAGSTTLPPDPLAWMDVDVEEDMRLIDNVELLVRTAVGKLAADAGPKRNAANSLKATVLYIESNLGRLRDPNESIICPHRYLTPPVQLRADREGLGKRRLRDEGPEFAEELRIVADHRRHQRSAVVRTERRDGEGEQDGIPQTPGAFAGDEEGQQAVAVREDQVLAVFDLGGP